MSPVNQQSRGAMGAARAASVPDAESLAAGALSVLTGETSLARVRYEFRAHADPDAEWLVAQVEISEALHTPYSALIELVSMRGEDVSGLLGTACTLSILRDDARRFVHGIVSRIEAAAPGDASGATRVTIVPALGALAHRRENRIFQDATVPEVLDAVLGPALEAYARKHEQRLRRDPYPRREYIVQYRETDLAFIERLMADEGLWYSFVHPEGDAAEDAELLIIRDSNEDAPDAKLGPEGDLLPLQLDHNGVAFWQAVTSLTQQRKIAPTSLTVREYNWTNPMVFEQASSPAEEPGDRPLYEPYQVTLWDYQKDAKKFSQFDTKEQARLRWEEYQLRAERAIGRSNVVGMCPGQIVVVKGHSKELDGQWLIAGVDARGRDAKNFEQAVEHLEDYANSFELVRKELPYRPVRSDKPRVQGIQTGVVVGADGKSEVEKGGDDIHTDEHGRIQVKMSWDRTPQGEAGATVTPFLRVAQVWGGNGWGFMFTPRIGMEVIVSFVDGDPDRPLVTGCVYNGFNRAPHELPQHKTKSYIRTQSTPSGDGFNELQFEDASGQEQVYLHAQRDHKEVVERDQTIEVKAAQSLSVGASRTKSVAHDETATIKKTRTHTVHGDETLRVVDGSNRLEEISGNDTRRVSKDDGLEVTGATKHTHVGGREVNVKTADALNVLEGANKNDHVTGQYNITADNHFKVMQGADELYMKDNFYVSSAGDVQLKNAGFHLHGQKNGKTSIDVGSELEIKVGRASITLKADGTIEISGPTAAKLIAQGGSVEAAIQGVKCSGQMVTIEGTAMTSISGAMVKIN